MKLKVTHETGTVTMAIDVAVQGWNSNGNSWDWPTYLSKGSTRKYTKKMVDEDDGGKPHSFYISGDWVSAFHTC